MRGLYIHIPFCKQICSYCDFPKMVSKKENYRTYINRLLEELEYKKTELINIDTVYIGGGTPNTLDNDLLELLFKKISSYLINSKENTIECNPELVTDSQAKLFKKYRINRVSLGVQSIDSNNLKILGRKHTKEDVSNAIRILRENGIQNINLDFIYGIPYQTIDSLKKDFEYVIEENIPHVSFYSLILEDKTILCHKLNKKEIELLDDDIIADMEEWINKAMIEHDYNHYEVSNYSKTGFESKHNSIYWTCNEYVGVGLGASGYIKPYRYSNNRTLSLYMNQFEGERTIIDSNEEKNEFMMLGLRMLCGISLSEYKLRFNSDCLTDFDLSKFLSNGLLKIEGDRLFIPEDKIFIANQVYMEFV